MRRTILVLGAIALSILGSASGLGQSPDRDLNFWNEQRRGANFFNAVETEQRVRDAAETGIEFIRLAPSKWRSQEGHTLIGDLAEPYDGLNDELLDQLLGILDAAERHDVKVIVTLLDLPCLWGRSAHAERSDSRLWTSEDCQQQAEAVWRDLAGAVRDHPALVGYNPLNEPQPLRAIADLDDPTADAYRQLTAEGRGSLADINRFNRRLVRAIRSVDKTTAIHVEPPAYADPGALRFMDPIDDPHIVYSVHFYPSWQYGTYRANRGRFRYPGHMPVDWAGHGEPWEAGQLCSLMDPVLEWASDHGVPRHQLIVSEFGVSRRVSGAHTYLSDIVACLESHQFHWAFYAYREDSWDEMDYELSPQTYPQAWVESVDGEAGYRVKPWQNSDLFEVIRMRLQNPD